jgi:hypothetical protein
MNQDYIDGLQDGAKLACGKCSAGLTPTRAFTCGAFRHRDDVCPASDIHDRIAFLLSMEED